MTIMYTNFAKVHTVSLIFRFSRRPKCLKSSQSVNLRHNQFFSSGFHQKTLGNNNGVKPRKALPWLAEYRGSRSDKEADKSLPRKANRNSWEDSKKNILLKNGGNSASESRDSKVKRTVDGRKNGRNNSSSWEEKDPRGKTGRSSWDSAANSYFLRNEGNPPMEKRVGRIRTVDGRENAKGSASSWGDSENNRYLKNGGNSSFGNRDCKTGTVDDRKKYGEGISMRRDGEDEEDEDEEDEEEDAEVVDDPRWDQIQNKFKRMVDKDIGFEKPEVSRWNKQENWGRKTWEEATESSVPKMHGEGIYGVGPILAALTVGRREFYALYVQEGLDLSSNNRKKKDKKGVEKVLKIAEKIGLSVKETSKHDLNMIVDSRPHQGLVLDASPLEMVRITELEPVTSDRKKGFLWIALDEVTDPQNLGAIVRSAYFFGAEGVVVCAKNSAPLSGVVSKASAGSLELIELRYCKNMMQFLASSIENGWRVLGGSVSSRALPLNEVVAGKPTILVLGSEGSGLSGNIGKKNNHGGGDGGDDGGDDDDYFGDFEEGDEGDDGGLFRRRLVFEELFDRKFVDAVLQEWYRTVMDLPAGLRQAYEMGLVSSAQMVKFLEINARPTTARFISRALPQAISRAFIGRMLADPSFLYKMLLEQAATIGCSVWWELKNRRERIKQEWDLALINVLTVTACNAIVVWSLAPCRSYGNTFRFDLQNTIQKLPNNIFEKSYPLREFDLQKRIHSFFYKAAELCTVGLAAGAAQGALTKLSASKKEGRLSVTIPSMSTNALGYGAFLGLYANMRYQLLFGIDQAMHSHFDVLGVVIFFSTAFRIMNVQIGETSRLAWLGVGADPLVQSDNLLKAYNRPSEASANPVSNWFISKNAIVSGLGFLGIKQGGGDSAVQEDAAPLRGRRKRIVRKKVTTNS